VADFLALPKGFSRWVAVVLSTVVVAVVIVSAFVLFSMPLPQTTTTSSTPSTSSQTSIATKFVFTDIQLQGNLSGSIAANVNEVFIIHLAANTGSTGYDWNVSTSGGVSYINYTTTSVGTLPGAPAERDYRFQALTPGEATITLVYGRFPPAFSVPQIAETIRLSVNITA
jgi:predicted secreted protein